MDGLTRDVRHAFRALARSRGFTASSILVLGLGIGAVTALFSVLNGVLLRPLPYPDADAIVRVAEQLPQMPAGGRRVSILTNLTFHAWRDSAERIEQLAAYSPREVTLGGGEAPVRLRGSSVSPELFALLRARPAAGRTFTSEEGAVGANAVAVLSDSLWRTRFGADPEVVGRAISLDDVDHTIVGLMPPDFYFPDRETELWTSMAVPPPSGGPGEVNIFAFAAIARLKPGVSVAAAAAEGTTAAKRAQLGPGGGPAEGAAIRLVPLREELVGEVRPAILMLFAAVALAFLIANANLAGLLLARGMARSRELAVRAALGAGRGRLVRERLVEGALLAAAGGSLGVALAWVGVRALPSLLPAGFPRADGIVLDAAALGFGVLLSALSCLLFALVPALRAAGMDPLEALSHDRTTTGGHGSRLRAGLVVAQVALAAVLVVGAGLLLRSFGRLIDVDPGYEAANLLTAELQLPPSRYSAEAKAAFFASLLESLNADPAVEAAALSSKLPLLPGHAVVGFTIPGNPPPASPADVPTAAFRVVSSGYERAMGMRLVSGRFLDERDVAGAEPVMVVNESFVRAYLADRDPFGVQIPELLESGTPPVRIVGVVGDVRHEGLDSEPMPELFVSSLQAGDPGHTRRGPFLAVRTQGDPVAFASALATHVSRLDPQLALSEVRTMESRVSASIAEPRLYAVLVGALGGLALLLAAVGLYGILAQSVVERQRELGVRMAVGAGARDILGLVIGRGLRLTAIGLVIGGLVAALLAPALQSLLFGVQARDAFTFGAVALLMVAVATLACALPARRALRIDPAVALRAE